MNPFNCAFISKEYGFIKIQLRVKIACVRERKKWQNIVCPLFTDKRKKT